MILYYKHIFLYYIVISLLNSEFKNYIQFLLFYDLYFIIVFYIQLLN
jgi:hypothetical protein